MVLGVIGVLRGDFIGGMWQFLIGLFLRAAASSGYQQTMAQRLLAGVSVAQMMTPDPSRCRPTYRSTGLLRITFTAITTENFPSRATVNCWAGLAPGGSPGSIEADGHTSVGDIAQGCTPEDIIAPETGALEAIAQMAASPSPCENGLIFWCCRIPP